jgi:hypothetical protein
MQQRFSTERQPTLWDAIPAIEELQTSWETKASLSKFVAYREAIEDGIAKLRKYYNRFDDKWTFIMSQGQ